MKTIFIILGILIALIYILPTFFRYVAKNTKYMNKYHYKGQNDSLLSNMQNLDNKYNKNVVRGKNGRFMPKNG